MTSTDDYKDDDMAAVGHTITDDMVETACAAYTTEYCGGEAEWPDGWNPARADDHRAAIRAAISSFRLLAETEARPAADLREVVALAICNSERGPNTEFHLKSFDDELAWSIGADLYRKKTDVALSAISAAGYAVVPREPTEAMHDAARDWSISKYGQGIGRDASLGCYRAMVRAALATKEPGK